MKYRIQHISYWFLRIFIGLILFTTGVGKAADVPGFVKVIRTYETGLVYSERCFDDPFQWRSFAKIYHLPMFIFFTRIIPLEYVLFNQNRQQK